jgi:hypothetical protein
MTHKLTRTALTLLALVMMTAAALAADPGNTFTPTVQSDQYAGSVLIYNLYSSGSTGGTTNNTRVSITNTNAQKAIAVHFYFVDGANCTIADSYVCLTANQTASFLTSDIDPGIAGHIVAVASDEQTGAPISFNFLIGDAYVKLDSGHAASLGAEAVPALAPTFTDMTIATAAGGSASLVVFGTNSTLANVNNKYASLPRVLAVSNIPSPADGNQTLVIVNRLGGNYALGIGSVGVLFGLLFDDAENVFSWSASASGCQLRATISATFPRTTPRVDNIIPAGRSGWAKFWSTSTLANADAGLGFLGGTNSDPRAISGAMINRNANAAAQANAFNGGHNLHILTLTPYTFTFFPIFAPSC